MHNNYYFLRKLSTALGILLSNSTISACFSQEKDELVLVFVQNEEEIVMKVALTANFTLISLPTQYTRAKANSADVLQVLVGHQVLSITQHLNERSFEISLTGNLKMVFKLYGRQGNILVYQNDKFLQSFNQKLKQDENLLLTGHDRPIEQTFERFINAEGNIATLYPTLGKIALSTLSFSEEQSMEQKWARLSQLVLSLEQAKHFYIVEIEGVPFLSLLPVGKTLYRTVNPIEATNLYAQAYLREYQLAKEKKELNNELKKQIARIESYITNAKPKLEMLKLGRKNDEIANVIMANLHLIPKGVSEVSLFDFYTDKDIVIRLNKNLSPQANAENYYKKSKNEWREVAKLEETLLLKEHQKKKLELIIEEVSQINELKELRQKTKVDKLQNNQAKPSFQDLFKVFTIEGFVVLVGKNSENNDLLTQKYANKDDIWLHARHVSGSHVVIKQQSGKIIPLRVIEKAAEITAYYSKSKSESMASVMYTFKKFVRKPKGSPPGAVVVDKEEVILVKPQLLI